MLSRIFRAQYERGLDSTGSEYVQWLISKNTWREKNEYGINVSSKRTWKKTKLRDEQDMHNIRT
jgi:hypothetical protein